MKIGKILVLVLGLTLGMYSRSAVITVDDDGPADFSTIQAAINAAQPNDTVMVLPGTYTGSGNRDIDFLSKAITVRSLDPGDSDIVETTVIDCQGSQADPHGGFLFIRGEGNDSVLTGLTITGAYQDECIGYLLYMSTDVTSAVYCLQSSPTIQHCIIRDNLAQIFDRRCCYDCGCVNGIFGAGISSYESSPVIDNCIFYGNTAINTYFGNVSYSLGAAVYSVNDQTHYPRIRNCVFFDNSAYYPGAAIASYTDTLSQQSCEVINSIFLDNHSDIQPQQPDVFTHGLAKSACSPYYSTVDFSILQSDWYIEGQGNLYSADPLLSDPNSGDFHILPGSPAVNAGDPNFAVPYEAVDLDGQPRILDGRIDIGVDEYPSDTPFLACWPRSLSFYGKKDHADPDPQTLRIWNPGAGTVSWEITEDCPWLAISPIVGKTSSEPNMITVEVNTAGLEAGEHLCGLKVTDPNAANKSLSVSVALNIHGPVIEFSEDSFFFSSHPDDPNPSDQTLLIRNAGGSTLHWEISESCPWLQVSPVSGSSYEESDEVTIHVDTSGLSGGAYNCVLNVFDPNAENNPQTVSVALLIDEPSFNLSPTSIQFTAYEGGGNPPAQTLVVKNTGGGILQWNLDESCDWLSVDKTSGELSYMESEPIVLSADMAALPPGSYSCPLTFTDPDADNSPQVIDVGLIVHGPIFEVVPLTFFFESITEGVNPPDQILSIRNSGGGVLTWQITKDGSWLTAEPAEGISTGESTDVTLHVDVQDLAFNQTYACSLQVSDPNAENNPITVSVTLKYEGNCFAGNADTMAAWVQFGKPDCWCYEYNCRGDANGRIEGTIKSSYKWVYLMDLMILSNAYNRPEPPVGQGIANLIIDEVPAICADFARDQEGSTKTGFKRVYLHDLNILTTSYNVAEPTKGPGLPICPLTTAGGDIVYYKYRQWP